MRELRNFTDSSPVSLCIKMKTSPLIKISSGEISYYTTPNEKKEALQTRAKTDKFIIVWAGQYSSDVFVLNDIDILDAINKLD
jgi:hypothetical protein